MTTMRKEGLTLVEVLVAVAILSLVVVTLSGTLTSGLSLRRISLQTGTANRYAENVIDRYKSDWTRDTAYAAASAPANIPAPPAGFDGTVGVAIENIEVNGTVSSAAVPPIRRVTVTVTRDGAVKAKVTTEIGKPVDQKGNQAG